MMHDDKLMPYGKALFVLKDPENFSYSDICGAIDKVLSMATINAVTKDMLLNALKYEHKGRSRKTLKEMIEAGMAHNLDEPKALPCPFCGDKQIKRNQVWFVDSTRENMRHEDGTLKWSFLKCSRCGVGTGAYCYEHQALDIWNMSADSNIAKRRTKMQAE